MLHAKRVFFGTWNCGPATVTFFPDKIQFIPESNYPLPGTKEYPLITVPTATLTGFQVDKQTGALGIWALWEAPFDAQARWNCFVGRGELGTGDCTLSSCHANH